MKLSENQRPITRMTVDADVGFDRRQAKASEKGGDSDVLGPGLQLETARRRNAAQYLANSGIRAMDGTLIIHVQRGTLHGSGHA